MSHRTPQTIHGYADRALDIQVDVDTDSDPGDFSAITFRVGDAVIEKTGLSASAGGSGVTIDVTLTAADMAIPAGWYRWECFATVSGEVYSIAQGWFHIGSEPTEEGSS